MRHVLIHDLSLTPLSCDPNDPLPLTPGHFLTGQPLTSLPEPDYTYTISNRLSQWQRTQQLMQHFWARWSKEYLSQLQQRQKWTTQTNNIEPGQVVIIKDDNLPPLKWITAIVEKVHPGVDGKARVATVKTSTGHFKRAVNRLCVCYPLKNESVWSRYIIERQFLVSYIFTIFILKVVLSRWAECSVPYDSTRLFESKFDTIWSNVK